MLSHDLFFKGTVQLPEPAKQISPEQLKFEVNICKRLNVLARMVPVQILSLLFLCLVQYSAEVFVGYYFQKNIKIPLA
jgi:hypothetical protein